MKCRVSAKYYLPFSTLEPLCVCYVLGSSKGAFVTNQVLPADDRHFQIPNMGAVPVCPSFWEINAINSCQDINTIRRDADLEYGPCRNQVCLINLVHRRAKLRQSGHDPPSVFRRTSNPEIQIPGCAGQAVRSQGIRSNDQILNPPAGEYGQYVSEIRIQQRRLP